MGHWLWAPRCGCLVRNHSLGETINISVDELFKNNNKFEKFIKTEFKTLVEVACKNAVCLFVFYGTYYH